MCGTSAEVKVNCAQNKMNEAFDCVRVRYDIYEEVKWVDSRDALKMAAQNLNNEASLLFCCKYMYNVVKIFSKQQTLEISLRTALSTHLYTAPKLLRMF